MNTIPIKVQVEVTVRRDDSLRNTRIDIERLHSAIALIYEGRRGDLHPSSDYRKAIVILEDMISDKEALIADAQTIDIDMADPTDPDRSVAQTLPY